MSEERIIEVVHPLLKQLAEARSLAAKYADADASSVIDEMFSKIEGEVQFIKGIFLRLEKWERDVKDQIAVIAKSLDDVLEDTGSKDEFQSQIQTVNQKVSYLREHMTPPLQLPPPESNSVTPSLPISSSSSIAHEVLRKFEINTIASFPFGPVYVKKKYKKFSSQLKDCLLSLSIFPKDSVIKKRPLIYWWIGEGLITPTSGGTAEEMGENCFRKLISEGLITPIYRNHNMAGDSCRIQHWIRDQLILLAMAAETFSFNSRGMPSPYLSTSSRASLLMPIDDVFSERITVNGDFNPNKFLTCFNVNRRYLRFYRSEFMLMRNAAVLQLGRWQNSAKHHIEVENTEFLEWLGAFKTLKYLSLCGISRIMELPASIGELTNLRILDLRACHNLVSLPVEVTMLRMLTHLDASECYLLDHMPKGLGSLSELQVLKGFVIGSSRSQDPCQLGELSRLKKLRKLSINIGSDSVVAEGEFNQLSEFEALRSLTITWGVFISPSNQGKLRLSRVVTMTTIHVSPPPNLEKLDIRCFPRNTAPDWLSPSTLKNLKRLYIRGGNLRNLGGQERCTHVNMWGVEILRLRFLSELYMKEDELLNSFPNLAYLEIHECKKLRSTAFILQPKRRIRAE